MTQPSVVLAVEDGIARLTLDRPDLSNALTAEAASELGEAVKTLAADPSVRVVILTGTGSMFCAGGDIRQFITLGERLAPSIQISLGGLNETLLALAALPCPIITALNGPVAGGGIGLALTADVLIAARSARFRAGYAAIGLSPDAGTSYHLTRLIGPQRAKEFLFTNRFIDADEALAIGLVTKVVPDDELQSEANLLAAKIASLPAGSHAAVKKLVNAAATTSHREMLELERQFIVANAASANAREGITAFIERRRPAFAG